MASNNHAQIDSLLESHGVKVTAIRQLVYAALARHRRPVSLRELDDELDTVDRSTIFRTLTLLHGAHLIHALEDGSGVALYEVCTSSDAEDDDDQHMHFYCTRCHRTYCFRTQPIPEVLVPEGFAIESVNVLIKGVCVNCRTQG